MKKTTQHGETNQEETNKRKKLSAKKPQKHVHFKLKSTTHHGKTLQNERQHLKETKHVKDCNAHKQPAKIARDASSEPIKTKLQTEGHHIEFNSPASPDVFPPDSELNAAESSNATRTNYSVENNDVVLTDETGVAVKVIGMVKSDSGESILHLLENRKDDTGAEEERVAPLQVVCPAEDPYVTEEIDIISVSPSEQDISPIVSHRSHRVSVKDIVGEVYCDIQCTVEQEATSYGLIQQDQVNFGQPLDETKCEAENSVSIGANEMEEGELDDTHISNEGTLSQTPSDDLWYESLSIAKDQKKDMKKGKSGSNQVLYRQKNLLVLTGGPDTEEPGNENPDTEEPGNENPHAKNETRVQVGPQWDYNPPTDYFSSRGLVDYAEVYYEEEDDLAEYEASTSTYTPKEKKDSSIARKSETKDNTNTSVPRKKKEDCPSLSTKSITQSGAATSAPKKKKFKKSATQGAVFVKAKSSASTPTLKKKKKWFGSKKSVTQGGRTKPHALTTAQKKKRKRLRSKKSATKVCASVVSNNVPALQHEVITEPPRSPDPQVVEVQYPPLPPETNKLKDARITKIVFEEPPFSPDSNKSPKQKVTDNASSSDGSGKDIQNDPQPSKVLEQTGEKIKSEDPPNDIHVDTENNFNEEYTNPKFHGLKCSEAPVNKAQARNIQENSPQSPNKLCIVHKLQADAYQSEEIVETVCQSEVQTIDKGNIEQAVDKDNVKKETMEITNLDSDTNTIADVCPTNAASSLQVCKPPSQSGSPFRVTPRKDTDLTLKRKDILQQLAVKKVNLRKSLDKESNETENLQSVIDRSEVKMTTAAIYKQEINETEHISDVPPEVSNVNSKMMPVDVKTQISTRVSDFVKEDSVKDKRKTQTSSKESELKGEIDFNEVLPMHAKSLQNNDDGEPKVQSKQSPQSWHDEVKDNDDLSDCDAWSEPKTQAESWHAEGEADDEDEVSNFGEWSDQDKPVDDVEDSATDGESGVSGIVISQVLSGVDFTDDEGEEDCIQYGEEDSDYTDCEEDFHNFVNGKMEHLIQPKTLDHKQHTSHQGNNQEQNGREKHTNDADNLEQKYAKVQKACIQSVNDNQDGNDTDSKSTILGPVISEVHGEVDFSDEDYEDEDIDPVREESDFERNEQRANSMQDDCDSEETESYTAQSPVLEASAQPQHQIEFDIAEGAMIAQESDEGNEADTEDDFAEEEIITTTSCESEQEDEADEWLPSDSVMTPIKKRRRIFHSQSSDESEIIGKKSELCRNSSDEASKENRRTHMKKRRPRVQYSSDDSDIEVVKKTYTRNCISSSEDDVLQSQLRVCVKKLTKGELKKWLSRSELKRWKRRLETKKNIGGPSADRQLIGPHGKPSKPEAVQKRRKKRSYIDSSLKDYYVDFDYIPQSQMTCSESSDTDEITTSEDLDDIPLSQRTRSKSYDTDEIAPSQSHDIDIAPSQRTRSLSHDDHGVTVSYRTRSRSESSENVSSFQSKRSKSNDTDVSVPAQRVRSGSCEVPLSHVKNLFMEKSRNASTKPTSRKSKPKLKPSSTTKSTKTIGPCTPERKLVNFNPDPSFVAWAKDTTKETEGHEAQVSAKSKERHAKKQDSSLEQRNEDKGSMHHSKQKTKSHKENESEQKKTNKSPKENESKHKKINKSPKENKSESKKTNNKSPKENESERKKTNKSPKENKSESKKTNKSQKENESEHKKISDKGISDTEHYPKKSDKEKEVRCEEGSRKLLQLIAPSEKIPNQKPWGKTYSIPKKVCVEDQPENAEHNHEKAGKTHTEERNLESNKKSDKSQKNLKSSDPMTSLPTSSEGTSHQDKAKKLKLKMEERDPKSHRKPDIKPQKTNPPAEPGKRLPSFCDAKGKKVDSNHDVHDSQKKEETTKKHLKRKSELSQEPDVVQSKQSKLDIDQVKNPYKEYPFFNTFKIRKRVSEADQEKEMSGGETEPIPPKKAKKDHTHERESEKMESTKRKKHDHAKHKEKHHDNTSMSKAANHKEASFKQRDHAEVPASLQPKVIVHKIPITQQEDISASQTDTVHTPLKPISNPSTTVNKPQGGPYDEMASDGKSIHKMKTPKKRQGKAPAPKTATVSKPPSAVSKPCGLLDELLQGMDMMDKQMCAEREEIKLRNTPKKLPGSEAPSGLTLSSKTSAGERKQPDKPTKPSDKCPKMRRTTSTRESKQSRTMGKPHTTNGDVTEKLPCEALRESETLSEAYIVERRQPTTMDISPQSKESIGVRNSPELEQALTNIRRADPRLKSHAERRRTSLDGSDALPPLKQTNERQSVTSEFGGLSSTNTKASIRKNPISTCTSTTDVIGGRDRTLFTDVKKSRNDVKDKEQKESERVHTRDRREVRLTSPSARSHDIRKIHDLCSPMEKKNEDSPRVNPLSKIYDGSRWKGLSPKLKCKISLSHKFEKKHGSPRKRTDEPPRPKKDETSRNEKHESPQPRKDHSPRSREETLRARLHDSRSERRGEKLNVRKDYSPCGRDQRWNDYTSQIRTSDSQRFSDSPRRNLNFDKLRKHRDISMPFSSPGSSDTDRDKEKIRERKTDDRKIINDHNDRLKPHNFTSPCRREAKDTTSETGNDTGINQGGNNQETKTRGKTGGQRENEHRRNMKDNRAKGDVDAVREDRNNHETEKRKDESDQEHTEKTKSDLKQQCTLAQGKGNNSGKEHHRDTRRGETHGGSEQEKPKCEEDIIGLKAANEFWNSSSSPPSNANNHNQPGESQPTHASGRGVQGGRVVSKSDGKFMVIYDTKSVGDGDTWFSSEKRVERAERFATTDQPQDGLAIPVLPQYNTNRGGNRVTGINCRGDAGNEMEIQERSSESFRNQASWPPRGGFRGRGRGFQRGEARRRGRGHVFTTTENQGLGATFNNRVSRPICPITCSQCLIFVYQFCDLI